MNRAPSIVWALRKNQMLPYVHTGDGDTIKISFQDPESDHYALTHVLSRKDARLLAKRINQCLDYTRKK